MVMEHAEGNNNNNNQGGSSQKGASGNWVILKCIHNEGMSVERSGTDSAVCDGEG
jgi:hypothetical protein